jgi:hypothetical protein
MRALPILNALFTVKSNITAGEIVYIMVVCTKRDNKKGIVFWQNQRK